MRVTYSVIIFLCLFFLGPNIALAQPTAGSDLGSKSVTDLGDVSGTTGPGTILATGDGPFTSGECVEFDANGDLVASGVACGGGGGATTEAQLEAQLTDVTDVFTNNDGALDDDDVTDDSITALSDVTAISGNTTVVGTTSGVLGSGNCAEFDANGNLVDSGGICQDAATTEAALETQLTDTADVHTVNDADIDLTPSTNFASLGLLTTAPNDDSCLDLVSAGAGRNDGGSLRLCGDDHATDADLVELEGDIQLLPQTADGIQFVYSGVTSYAWLSNILRTSNNLTIRADDNLQAYSIYPGTGLAGSNAAGMQWVGNSFGSGIDGRIRTWIGTNGNARWEIEDGTNTDKWIFENDMDLVPATDNDVDIGAAGTEVANVYVEPDAYGVGWNGSSAVPTKDAVYDQIESIVATPGGADTELQYNDGGAFGGASVFYNDTNSDLGVGATPLARLHVEDNANELLRLHRDTTGNPQNTIQYYDDDGRTAIVGHAFATGALDFFNQNNAPIALHTNSTNRFDVSTTNAELVCKQTPCSLQQDDDTSAASLCGGSSCATSAGSRIQANGISGANVGDLVLEAATNASSDIRLRTGTTTADQWLVNADGDLLNQADNNVEVQTEVYGVAWDGSNEVPTKDAVYDKIETLGGGGGTAGLTYYDHVTTWPAGTTSGAALADFTITHNVGRYPDKVVVYMERGATAWEQATPFYTFSGLFYGWDSLNAGNDDLNETRIRFYGNTDNALRNAFVRLFWHTDDEIGAATTGLKTVNGGAGSNALITYYNHNFTWPAGTITTIGGANIESVTHNVGRPPDKVVVYVQGSGGDWTEAQGQWRNQATNYYGWSVDFAGAVDENNVTRVRLFSNEDLTADPALIRLFWFSDDDIAAAVDGRVDIATSQGTSLVTGAEVLTGDTFDGKAVYAKVIDLGALPNATTKSVAHGVSGGIDFLLPTSAVVANRSSDNLNLLLSLASGPNAFDYFTVDSDTGANIDIVTSSDRTLFDGTAILYYTKP